MAPCAQHWLGTDEFGRDMFARIIHGSRRSLSLGVGTTAVSLFFGGIIGACCGLYGSRFDSIVMRLCDILSSVPGLLFALAVVAALGSSMTNLLIWLLYTAAQENAELAQKFGVMQAPTLVVADGDSFTLYANASNIRRYAQENAGLRPDVVNA